MTPEERRAVLGIPFHATEKDHQWRSDGYCNCGESKPVGCGKSRRVPPGGLRTRGRSNIDVIEGNSEVGF